MIPLSITLDVERSPWDDLPPEVPHGMLSRVGLLRHGTVEGRATVGIVVTLDDGTHVVAETTWALLRTAFTALEASPIVAEEVIDP